MSGWVYRFLWDHEFMLRRLQNRLDLRTAIIHVFPKDR